MDTPILDATYEGCRITTYHACKNNFNLRQVKDDLWKQLQDNLECTMVGMAEAATVGLLGTSWVALGAVQTKTTYVSLKRISDIASALRALEDIKDDAHLKTVINDFLTILKEPTV